jgi:hypothetical protein
VDDDWMLVDFDELRRLNDCLWMKNTIVISIFDRGFFSGKRHIFAEYYK